MIRKCLNGRKGGTYLAPMETDGKLREDLDILKHKTQKAKAPELAGSRAFYINPLQTKEQTIAKSYI